MIERGGKTFVITAILVVAAIVVVAGLYLHYAIIPAIHERLTQQDISAPWAIQTSVSQPAGSEVCPIIDYGNEVIFFGCTSTDYARALSRYIGEKNVTATSVTAIPNGRDFNNDIGYLVTFSGKTKELV